MAKKTRLGLSGFTRGLYGSFAGKAESGVTVKLIAQAKAVGRFVQARIFGRVN